MFETKDQRFLTPGIKEGVPLEVQLLPLRAGRIFEN